jgi:lysozyme family protein
MEMDRVFLYAAQELLDNEGGYVNDPSDPGDETKFGISKRNYPHLDIANLTREQALEIYYNDWWVRYRYWRIEDLELAGELLDLSANMGPSQAHRLLQRAVGKTKWEQLKEDGILGEVSITAINSHPNIWWLTDRFRLEAIKFYLNLSKSKYLASWVRRSLT